MSTSINSPIGFGYNNVNNFNDDYFQQIQLLMNRKAPNSTLDKDKLPGIQIPKRKYIKKNKRRRTERRGRKKKEKKLEYEEELKRSFLIFENEKTKKLGKKIKNEMLEEMEYILSSKRRTDDILEGVPEYPPNWCYEYKKKFL